jgi:hypothetical protein
MRTGRAGGGVGFRDLNREQTQNQHAGSGCLPHLRVPSNFDVSISRAVASSKVNRV